MLKKLVGSSPESQALIFFLLFGTVFIQNIV